MPRKLFVILWLISILAFSSSVWAETVSTLLEKGIYAEETKGDLKEAISIYQKIIKDNNSNRINIAKVYYRLGSCYLKTGDNTKAIEIFKELMARFPEQGEMASEARAQLVKLNALNINKPLKLGPVPWKAGETCWYNLGTPVIKSLGNMILSIRNVTYEKDHIQVDIDSQDTKNTKEIPINNIVYDYNQLNYLLRRLPIAEGYSTTFSVFNPQTGNVTKAELRTTGLETVKVPAGTFECYHVELELDSKIKIKEWYSADDKKYLVKGEAPQGTIELEKVVQVSRDEPEVFNDSKFGISMSAPAGWHIFKSSITAPPFKMSLQIVSPELKAAEGFVVVPYPLDTLSHLRATTIPELKQIFKNFTPRPESWVHGEIDGLPSLTYIADYDKEGKKMAEYRTYILNKQQLGSFCLRTDKKTFDEIKTDIDSIVQSFKWNKK